MNELASKSRVGAGGIRVLPFGNGAERTLGNRNLGASIQGLDFNQHSAADVLRATQEGIVFALNYGLDIMREMGMSIRTVRAGHANMFLSGLFAQTFADVTGATVELYEADGAQGAARAAGVGADLVAKSDLAKGLTLKKTITPGTDAEAVKAAYQDWFGLLKRGLDA